MSEARAACLERARGVLAGLESDSDTPDSDLRLFHNILEIGGLSLNDLGMTQGGLRKIVNRCYLAKARRTLEALRAGASGADDVLTRLRRELNRANAALEAIGTSEQELSKIMAEYHLAKARYALELLTAPEGTSIPEFELGQITAELKLARGSLRDLGITEQRLTEIMAGYNLVD